MGFFDRFRRAPRTDRHLDIVAGYRTTPHQAAFNLASSALYGLTQVEPEHQVPGRVHQRVQIRAMIEAGNEHLYLSSLNTPTTRRLLEIHVTNFIGHTNGSMDITEAASDLLVTNLEDALARTYGNSVPCTHWSRNQVVNLYHAGTIRRALLTGRTCALCEVSPTGIVFALSDPVPTDLSVAACINDDCGESVTYKKTSV